jgi:hypothetical protein
MRNGLQGARTQSVEGERALAAAARELANELRLTDIVDLIAFIRTENHPNLNDLVNSSAELYFKPGTLSYGWRAEIDMRWTGSPTVKLDLEFRHQHVTAFFNLVLEPRRAGVELKGLAFEPPAPPQAENVRKLIDAIADARLPQRSTAPLQ